MMPENLRALRAGWLWRDRRAVEEARRPSSADCFGRGGYGCRCALLFLMLLAKMEEAVRLFWWWRRRRWLLFFKQVEQPMMFFCRRRCRRWFRLVVLLAEV